MGVVDAVAKKLGRGGLKPVNEPLLQGCWPARRQVARHGVGNSIRGSVEWLRVRNYEDAAALVQGGDVRCRPATALRAAPGTRSGGNLRRSGDHARRDVAWGVAKREPTHYQTTCFDFVEGGVGVGTCTGGVSSSLYTPLS